MPEVSYVYGKNILHRTFDPIRGRTLLLVDVFYKHSNPLVLLIFIVNYCIPDACGIICFYKK